MLALRFPLQNFKNRILSGRKFPKISKEHYPVLVIVAVAVLNIVYPFRAAHHASDAALSPAAYEEKIKANIVAELRQEIAKIVKAELKESAARENTERITEKILQKALKKSVDSSLASAVENKLDTALNAHYARELVDMELGSYIAGALETGTQIANGLTKKSNPPQSKLNYSDLQNDASKQVATQDQAKNTRSEKEHAVERTLIQEGGLLLRKGTLQVEPSFTTAHFSSNRINIEGFSILPVLVIGEISTEAVQRDIALGALSIKYGLWRNLQTELKVPYRYEFDRVTSNLGVEKTREVNGLGDVESTLSTQIFRDRGGFMPDTIISFGAKSDTGADPYTNPIGLGTGGWSTRAGIVLVKSSDPAVVFSTLNYTWNYETNIANFGKIDPGNTVGFGLGTAIALSYQTAINFQLEQNLTSKLTRNGIPVNGSFMNSATFKTGFTWAISEKSALDFGVGMGLTTDAPDYVIELRLPYTF